MVARQSLSGAQGCSWKAEPSSHRAGACKNHRSVLDSASNDPEMRVFISICYPYISSPSCRLKTTKRALQGMFELQTPLQKHRTSASWKASQQPLPRASCSARPQAGAAAHGSTASQRALVSPRNTWAASLSPAAHRLTCQGGRQVGDQGHGGSILLGWDAAGSWCTVRRVRPMKKHQM